MKADLAEQSAVRGCMVIKPYGYAIWEKMHPTTEPTVQDEAMEQQWQVYQASKEKLSQGKGEANFMRREHGTTYWWYYQY